MALDSSPTHSSAREDARSRVQQPTCRRRADPKLSCAGARDDEVGLLRRAVLEYSSALEHKAARFPCNVPDDPLEADERGRAVAAVHHQVFDMPLARDIAGERLCDGGPSQLWYALVLTVRLLDPALDGESGVGNVLHVSASAIGNGMSRGATVCTCQIRLSGAA